MRLIRPFFAIVLAASILAIAALVYLHSSSLSRNFIERSNYAVLTIETHDLADQSVVDSVNAAASITHNREERAIAEALLILAKDRTGANLVIDSIEAKSIAETRHSLTMFTITGNLPPKDNKLQKRIEFARRKETIELLNQIHSQHDQCLLAINRSLQSGDRFNPASCSGQAAEAFAASAEEVERQTSN